MKVYLTCFFDNNIGDDLMIKFLIEKFPEINFYSVETDSIIKDTYKDNKNLIFFDSKKELKKYAKYDCQITIGGSLFQLRSFKECVRHLISENFEKSVLKKGAKRALIGCNFGPFYASFAKYVTKCRVKNRDFITVRDAKSYEFLRGLNLNSSEYYHFDDIVYNYDFGKEEMNEEILGVSVYQFKKNKKEIYEKLAFALDKYQEKYKSKIKLFCFDCEKENDLEAAYHLMKRMNNIDRVEVVPYLGEIDEFIEEMGTCDKIIAVRFHSAILSSILKIPFLPLAYSNKMGDYFTDYNLGEKVISSKRLEKMNKDEFSNLMMDFNSYISEVETKGNAKNHFTIIEEMLEGGKNIE